MAAPSCSCPLTTSLNSKKHALTRNQLATRWSLALSSTHLVECVVYSTKNSMACDASMTGHMAYSTTASSDPLRIAGAVTTNTVKITLGSVANTLAGGKYAIAIPPRLLQALRAPRAAVPHLPVPPREEEQRSKVPEWRAGDGMSDRRVRGGRGSMVSPMGQLILERSNTVKVSAEIHNVTTAITEVDKAQLMAHDQQPGLATTVKGILHLFFQRRVAVFFVFHIAFGSWAAVAEENIFHKRLSQLDLLSWVVGLLVAFRQNQSIQRFWEGRRAWGRLTTESRDVVRAILTHNNDKTTSMNFAMYVGAFSVCLKNALRGDQDCDETELDPLLDNDDLAYALSSSGYDRVVAILDLMSGTVVQMLNAGTITQEAVMLIIEPKISAMNDCLGITSRIKDTPIPQMYIWTLDIVMMFYLVCLPFALLSDSWDPIAIVVLCTVCNAVLHALTSLAAQTEDPFSVDPTDLPLGKFCGVILSQILHCSDRFYRPNSILFASKMEQQRKHELEEKFRRAQLKAMVVSALGSGSAPVGSSTSDLSPKDHDVVASPKSSVPLQGDRHDEQVEQQQLASGEGEQRPSHAHMFLKASRKSASVPGSSYVLQDPSET
ncbi:UPF0187 protein YneE [Durusdinium trenchii]|uniref:UPF0187 protein YneE n=1 Tax=Durusdinium trenchii TaxID=1381693 RepID=A0ABP0S274_9DINO